ncbi:MAG: glycerate kinase [Elusimicrobia bacterium]|nr:glycerate kinase [Elusimicrobiota bacterium]
MNVLIAPNAFKGTLSSARAARLLTEEVRRICPTCHCRILPLADGGDGTLDALAGRPGFVRRWNPVKGPRGERIRAPWLWDAAGRRAVVEMAAASGLALVPPRGRDPEHTTGFGTGELIDAARRAGAREIWVGLGGTATVDGGAGMLQAMGLGLFRGGDKLISPATGGDLERLTRLDATGFQKLWRGVRFVLLTDVRHRLTGRHGAAPVFGPQKGATKTQVARLARGLSRWAILLRRAGGRDPRSLDGGGAAGGAAAGLWSLARARVVPGARWLARRAGLGNSVKWADRVISGEGRVGRTTFEGKAVGELLRMVRRENGRALVVTGGVDPAARQRVKRSGARVLTLGRVPRTPGEAERVLARTVRAAFREEEDLFL